MRHFKNIVFFLFLFPTISFGQKNTYPYEYKIKVTNDSDSLIISRNSFPTKSNLIKFEGKAINRSAIPISGVIVFLSSIDTLLVSTTNESGSFSFAIKPGNYTLTTQSDKYQSTETVLNISNKFDVKYSLTLPRKEFIGIYLISSKTRLTDSEIENIKDCLRNKTVFKCYKKDYYLIEEEI